MRMLSLKTNNKSKRILATVAAAAMLSLSVGGVPTALAKEPRAEDIARCGRETAAYNAAWANTWAAANNKPASQAPPPPVPYKCGPVPDDAPPPTVPNAPNAPEINILKLLTGIANLAHQLNRASQVVEPQTLLNLRTLSQIPGTEPQSSHHVQFSISRRL